MENFRKAMYDTCLSAGLEIVPMDVGARVMAFAGIASGDERVTHSPRMITELQHLQKKYHIQGGEVPDKDFVTLIQEYTKELKEYTDTHDGEWCPWLNKLIEERYGFKPYKL